MIGCMMQAVRSIMPRRFKYFILEHFLKGELPNVRLSLGALKRKGFSPGAIVDCGAHAGDWTRMIKEIFPESQVLMVEACPSMEASLKKVAMQYHGTVDYVIALAGAEHRDEVKFFEMGTGSSVLEEQTKHPRTVVSLPMRRLDDILREKNIKQVSLFKLDVQGYELEVLKGAQEALRSTDVVFMEVSFLEYNKNAPLADEVMHFMRQRGFLAYDIGSIYRYEGVLLQADFLFIRADSPWRKGFHV